jgi:hypothetical protein
MCAYLWPVTKSWRTLVRDAQSWRRPSAAWHVHPCLIIYAQPPLFLKYKPFHQPKRVRLLRRSRTDFVAATNSSGVTAASGCQPTFRRVTSVSVSGVWSFRSSACVSAWMFPCFILRKYGTCSLYWLIGQWYWGWKNYNVVGNWALWPQ